MYPHERSLVKEYANRPFALIGINSDRDKAVLRKRIAEENITWRSFWNGPKGTRGPISATWNVSGWPTLYIIDHEGVIRYRGREARKNLDAGIKELVAKAESGFAIIQFMGRAPISHAEIGVLHFGNATQG